MKQEFTIDKFEVMPFVEMPSRRGKAMEEWQEMMKNHITLAQKILKTLKPVSDKLELSFSIHCKKKMDEELGLKTILNVLELCNITCKEIDKIGKAAIHKDKVSKVIICLKDVK